MQKLIKQKKRLKEGYEKNIKEKKPKQPVIIGDYEALHSQENKSYTKSSDKIDKADFDQMYYFFMKLSD